MVTNVLTWLLRRDFSTMREVTLILLRTHKKHMSVFIAGFVYHYSHDVLNISVVRFSTAGLVDNSKFV